MENKRLEQTGAHASHSAESGGYNQNRDWKKHYQREEELRSISARFSRLEEAKVPEVSPGQWKEFSKKLELALTQQRQGLGRTLRDRIRASDTNLVRWFWIIVAIIVLAVGALAIAMSLHVLPIKPKGLGVASPVFHHEISRTQV